MCLCITLMHFYIPTDRVHLIKAHKHDIKKLAQVQRRFEVNAIESIYLLKDAYIIEKVLVYMACGAQTDYYL